MSPPSAKSEESLLNRKVEQGPAEKDDENGVAKASLSAAAKKQFQSAFADIDKEIGNVNTLVAAGDFIQAKKIAQECLQRTIYNEKKLQGK